jgi:uncharacterized damage-inducible protein DinB
MRKIYLAVLAVAIVLSGTTHRAGAQDRSMTTVPPGVDSTPPSYDMKPQSLLDLENMQKKFVTLAQAIPADKYTWRPGQGVRSISEVFLHVAAMGFELAPILGAAPDPTFKKDQYEKSTTDKPKIIEELNRSFSYVQATIETKMTNADFLKPEKEFGPQANAGDIVYILITDDHEHLGQSVAYARMNAVIPPWTAEAQSKHAGAEK